MSIIARIKITIKKYTIFHIKYWNKYSIISINEVGVLTTIFFYRNLFLSRYSLYLLIKKLPYRLREYLLEPDFAKPLANKNHCKSNSDNNSDESSHCSNIRDVSCTYSSSDIGKSGYSCSTKIESIHRKKKKEIKCRYAKLLYRVFYFVKKKPFRDYFEEKYSMTASSSAPEISVVNSTFRHAHFTSSRFIFVYARHVFCVTFHVSVFVTSFL